MEFKDNKSIYLQIADYLTAGILLGKWKAEERVPSVREVAMELEVNPNTAMRAFEHLQAEGIIFNKRGIGYFVAPNAAGKIKAIRKKEFLQTELPAFFRNVYLLEISMEELKDQYEEFVARNFPADSETRNPEE